jgi:hypothetical protein
MGNPEKPKRRRQTSSVSSGHAKPAEFAKSVGPLVLEILLKILEDSYQRLSHYRHADYSRDVATLRRRYISEGLSFATKTLPDLFNNFLLFLETGKPSYPSFRVVRGGKHPVFLRQLFAMVSECHDERVCTAAIQCLYQLCHAFKKLRGPYKPSTLQKQLWSFVEEDIELRYLDFFSEPCYPILLKARDYVTNIFEGMDPEFDVEKFVPRPGPGSTNTPRRKNVRYRPHVLYEQLDAIFPYHDWFYSHPWDIVTGSLRFKALKRVSAPSSRFKFVPKTYGKPRGICIEELETQFIQQAVKGAMYDRIQSHPLTKGFVNFDDQSINGSLALSASGDSRYATLDMSSASDRVSRTLVRYLFHNCPEMREALMAISTKVIDLGKNDINFPQELPCEKFAPMGSAVCFPVMALVHFVLIKAILSLSELPYELTREVYVYGDDIIVRTECVQALYDYLPLFGMKFNTEKSYRWSCFRESCGVHAYKGVEITPAYFKYVPNRNSPRDIVLSLLSLESQLYYNGFIETARFLRSAIHKVRCMKGYDIPYTSPKSPALGFIRVAKDAPLKRHIGLKRRWNAELQSHEFRCISARPAQDDLVIEAENEAYLKAFCDYGINPERDESVWRRSAVGSSKGRSVSRISEGRSCPIHGLGRPYDISETLSCSQWLKDVPNEPPRFSWGWLPESAL